MMKGSFGRNGVHSQPSVVEEPTLDLLPAIKLERGRVPPDTTSLDEVVAWLLHDHPADGHDLLMHSLAQRANSLWRCLRNEASVALPSVHLSQAGEAQTVRFSYFSQGSSHSLAFIVRPNGLVDHKLVQAGRIQSYRLASQVADVPIVSLIRRYAAGLDASNHLDACTFGPINSALPPTARDVDEGLDVSTVYDNCSGYWDPSEPAIDISGSLTVLSMYCNPAFTSRGTAALLSRARRALAVWDFLSAWSEAYELPLVMASEHAHVYFGFKARSPDHCFQILIRSNYISWSLVLEGNVVSVHNKGSIKLALRDMQRFSFEAYGVPFFVREDRKAVAARRAARIQQLLDSVERGELSD